MIKKTERQHRKPIARVELAVLLVDELPPAIYMHSFGGSAAMVDALLAMERKRRSKKKKERKKQQQPASEDCPPLFYFGFSHAVNARSPKTPSVIAAVPDDRLLLESDLERSTWSDDSDSDDNDVRGGDEHGDEGEGEGEERGGAGGSGGYGGSGGSRGDRREAHLEAMVAFIAAAKGWTAEETRARTFENAERFYATRG